MIVRTMGEGIKIPVFQNPLSIASQLTSLKVFPYLQNRGYDIFLSHHIEIILLEDVCVKNGTKTSSSFCCCYQVPLSDGIVT